MRLVGAIKPKNCSFKGRSSFSFTDTNQSVKQTSSRDPKKLVRINIYFCCSLVIRARVSSVFYERGGREIG